MPRLYFNVSKIAEDAMLGLISGAEYFVDTANGSDSNDGSNWANAKATISAAITAMSSGDKCYIAAGRYTESVLIPFAKANIALIGVDGRGAAYIQPSTVGATGLDVRANDVTIVNLGVAGENTASFSLRVFGARFRAFNCKMESATNVAVIGPGTVAQQTALTHGNGADGMFDDCEICWSTNGIVITSSDYGACTQTRIRNCLFHNLTGIELAENDVGAIGSGRDIWIVENIFANQENAVEPTTYIDLDSAGTTGIVTGNRFATTIHDATKIKIAAGVLYVGNYTQAEGPATGGGTAGRPD